MRSKHAFLHAFIHRLFLVPSGQNGTENVISWISTSASFGQFWPEKSPVPHFQATLTATVVSKRLPFAAKGTRWEPIQHKLFAITRKASPVMSLGVKREAAYLCTGHTSPVHSTGGSRNPGDADRRTASAGSSHHELSKAPLCQSLFFFLSRN